MLLAGLLARAAVVPRQSLWADELFSLAMATGHSLEQPAAESDPARGDYVESPAAEPAAHYARYLEHERPAVGPGAVLRAVALSDTSPPLYYLALWAWTRALGTSDAALRVFSVLASFAALVLLALAARRAGGRGAVLPATALFALSPLAVHYSAEGRMYGLVLFWSSAILLLALLLRARGSCPRLLIAYALVGGGALLTHYFLAPVLAVSSLWLLLRPGRGRRGPLAAALVGAGAMALPWYAALPASLARWRVTGGWLRHVPTHYDPIWTWLEQPWAQLSVRAAEGVPAWVDYAVGTALLAVLLVALARRGLGLVRGPRVLPWLAAAAGVATPLALDAALGTYASVHPRYALAGLPALLIVVGLLLATLSPRRRAFVLALLLTASLAGTFRVQRAASRAAEPLDRVAAWLVRHADTRDVAIVHSIPSVVSGVGRAMVRAGAGADSVPIASWVAPLGLRSIPDDLETLAEGRRRVLLVKVHTVTGEVPAERWLRAHARLAREEVMERASVLVFEPWNGGAFRTGGPGAAGR